MQDTVQEVEMIDICWVIEILNFFLFIICLFQPSKKYTDLETTIHSALKESI